MEEGAQPARARFAAAGLVVLVSLVAIVIAAGSGGDPAPDGSADDRCIQLWNDDEAAVGYGVHLATGHGYARAQVRRLAVAGGTLRLSPHGSCTIVFAATSFDPELAARAQMYSAGQWHSLTSVSAIALGRLQSEAVAGANAELNTDGTLSQL